MWQELSSSENLVLSEGSHKVLVSSIHNALVLVHLHDAEFFSSLLPYFVPVLSPDSLLSLWPGFNLSLSFPFPFFFINLIQVGLLSLL